MVLLTSFTVYVAAAVVGAAAFVAAAVVGFAAFVAAAVVGFAAFVAAAVVPVVAVSAEMIIFPASCVVSGSVCPVRLLLRQRTITGEPGVDWRAGAEVSGMQP